MRWRKRQTEVWDGIGWCVLGLSLLVLHAPAAWSKTTSPPIVAGYIEEVWLEKSPAPFKAKLDTGATTSSIHAPAYEIFMRDGREWVRFTITNHSRKALVVERPIERVATIRRAGVKDFKRPVIALHACIGGKMATTQFTLADRSGMSVQVLIGRSFLAQRIVVDSAKSFIAPPACAQK